MKRQPELKDWHIFFEVARQGSFNQAAAILGISPAAVRRSISGTEASTGVMLFERSHHRVILTYAGCQLLNRLSPLINDIHDAVTGTVTAYGGTKRA